MPKKVEPNEVAMWLHTAIQEKFPATEYMEAENGEAISLGVIMWLCAVYIHSRAQLGQLVLDVVRVWPAIADQRKELFTRAKTP